MMIKNNNNNLMKMNSSVLIKEMKQLLQLLKATFGPNGLEVIMNKDGHIISTKNGLELLQSFSLSHPLCCLLREIAKTQHHLIGDGIKCLLIVMAAGITQLRKQSATPTDYSTSRSSLMTTCNSQSFVHLLDILMQDTLPMLCLKCEVDVKGIKCVRMVADTYFTSCCKVDVAELLTRLVCDKLPNSLPGISSSLKVTLDCIESLINVASGHSVTLSTSVNGLIIDKDNLMGCQLPTSKNISLAMLRCGFEFINNENSTIGVNSAKDVSSLYSYWTGYVTSLLRHLVSRGVQLLLVQGPVPVALGGAIEAAGLTIIPNVEKELITDMEEITGIIPLYELCELVTGSLSRNVYNTDYDVITWCGREYINIKCMIGGRTTELLPVSFLLVGPTLGVARQLKFAIKCCLQSLCKSFNKDNQLCYVYGGGAWQIELIRLLRKFNLNDNMSVCVSAIEMGLLEIVCALLNVQPPDRKYPLLHQKIYNTTDPLMVDVIEGCLVPLRHGIDMVIEPFNNVQQLMGCVCHGIAQIIKIGSIHHAINNRSLTNDNSIHDDDNDDNELK